MARDVFFSFHYEPDHWRAGQVRNIGTVEGNAPVSDNDWETVTGGGDAAIKKWIADQLKGKDCAVVLAGSNTAGRQWITHEIVEAWNKSMGVVVIHVNRLKNQAGEQSTKGGNPLDHVTHNGAKLSTIFKAYSPGGTSKEAYAWITTNLANAVEEAIKIRAQY
jgi:hypothetical protein